MNRCGVERILTVANAQETGRLLENGWLEARDFKQHLARGERTVCLAEADNAVCEPIVQSGYITK